MCLSFSYILAQLLPRYSAEEAKAGEELDEFDGEEGDYEGEEDDWDNESDDSNFVGMIDTQSLPW